MLKRMILIASAIILLLIALSIGVIIGQSVSKGRYERVAGYLSSLNAIGAYSASAEASNLIRAQRLDEARCKMDISASIYYRDLQNCLKDQPCREFILEEVEERAPELLGRGELKFRLYEHLEKCSL